MPRRTDKHEDEEMVLVLSLKGRPEGSNRPKHPNSTIISTYQRKIRNIDSEIIEKKIKYFTEEYTLDHADNVIKKRYRKKQQKKKKAQKAARATTAPVDAASPAVATGSAAPGLVDASAPASMLDPGLAGHTNFATANPTNAGAGVGFMTRNMSVQPAMSSLFRGYANADTLPAGTGVAAPSGHAYMPHQPAPALAAAPTTYSSGSMSNIEWNSQFWKYYPPHA